MGNRWLKALIYTLIFWVLSHAVFLGIGYFTGPEIGMFYLPMWWAHWTGGVLDAVIGIILFIIQYFIIYFLCTRDRVTD